MTSTPPQNPGQSSHPVGGGPQNVTPTEPAGSGGAPANPAPAVPANPYGQLPAGAAQAPDSDPAAGQFPPASEPAPAAGQIAPAPDSAPAAGQIAPAPDSAPAAGQIAPAAASQPAGSPDYLAAASGPQEYGQLPPESYPPAGAYGQVPPGAYGQVPPGVDPSAVPPQPPAKKRSPLVRILTTIGVIIIAAVVSFFVRTAMSGPSMKVGDCVHHVSGDEITTVACDSADADFRVVAVFEKTAQDNDSPCSAFPDTTATYWEGRSSASGNLFCLADA